jgi:hypothetical protein
MRRSESTRREHKEKRHRVSQGESGWGWCSAEMNFRCSACRAGASVAIPTNFSLNCSNNERKICSNWIKTQSRIERERYSQSSGRRMECSCGPFAIGSYSQLNWTWGGGVASKTKTERVSKKEVSRIFRTRSRIERERCVSTCALNDWVQLWTIHYQVLFTAEMNLGRLDCFLKTILRTKRH